MLREPPIAYRVSLVGRMLAAVDLDNEPLLAANEVHNVGSDGFLTDEFVAHQGARAQVTPQAKLRLGGICAQPAGPFRLELVWSAHADSPLTRRASRVDLSPQAGRGGACG